MVSIDENAEYTLFIADFIETLSHTENFLLKIWISNVELPFEFNQDCSFYFTQEGFRVDDGKMIDFIFYDNIASLRIIYG